MADGLIDPLAKQNPVGQASKRVVQRLVLVELRLADQVTLGAFALGDVLDHRHGAGSAVAVSLLDDGSQVRPDRPAVGHLAVHLDRHRLALARRNRRKQRVNGVPLLGHDVLAERATDELRGADAEHLLERGVDLHGPSLCIQAEDPDRGAVEQRPEPSQRSRLIRARLGLRGPRDRRREHHRQHLQRVAILLVEAILGAAHDVERADYVGAAQQRHADQTFVTQL